MNDRLDFPQVGSLTAAVILMSATASVTQARIINRKTGHQSRSRHFIGFSSEFSGVGVELTDTSPVERGLSVAGFASQGLSKSGDHGS
jgi:hypothetical protein